MCSIQQASPRKHTCTLDATAAPSITTSSLGSTTPHRAWVVVRAGCPHTATSDRNVEAQERGAEASGTVMVRLRVVTPRPQDPLQALQAPTLDEGSAGEGVKGRRDGGSSNNKRTRTRAR